jgi:uncharacterized membrane protein
LANLIAIAYPDQSMAEVVLATLARLQTERSIELEDAVIVTRDQDGKVKLHQSAKLGVAGAAGGAAGAMADVGVDDRLQATLESCEAAEGVKQ